MVEYCNLSGDGFMSLYNVPSMVAMGVAGNDDITGTLEGIENLVNLQELYVGETGMSGPLPEGLGALTKMKFIKSSQAAFTGALPASIGNLVDLEELDFSLNSLDGELPEELGQLTKLEKVALHGKGDCNIYICVVITSCVLSLFTTCISPFMQNHCSLYWCFTRIDW